ncbi:basic proline-rich protein-like [Labeo rohita]|uniref:basic proline-rich protein-like n=1 Tax=Labeo rohita TaxID=84645 RepID=UPI0021E2668B|nr:basic proline-rich protein-like [Labeo rohita]
MKQTWGRPGPRTSGGPPWHESPRRTTAEKTAAPTQKRAEESPEGDHPAATMQTSQGAAAASPQAPPAAGHTRADRPLGPAIQGPPPPSQGPAKPGGPGPAKRPPRVGQRSPEHPAPERVLHRQGVVAPLPPEGQSAPAPGAEPLHSGVETGRPPRFPAAAEKTTSPDPDRMANSSSQPPALDREQRTGVATRRQRSTTSPASQRHTRTPKPYLYVGVMEREKGSIRDGEEIIGGGKLKRPPDPPTRQRPPHQGRAQAHAPTHAPGGTPPRTQAPRPSRNPSPVAERPQNPKPPRTYSGAVRPPGRQPTSAGTGLPSSAACSRQKNNTQEPPTPHPGQDRSPSAEPPKKPTPRELPDAPSPYGPPPRQQQRPKPDRTVTPTHTR